MTAMWWAPAPAPLPALRARTILGYRVVKANGMAKPTNGRKLRMLTRLSPSVILQN